MNNESEKDLYSPLYDRWLLLTQHDFGNGISINRDCVALLGRISILSNVSSKVCEGKEIKGCWASNNYFAGLYFVSVSTIQDWIKRLSDCGLVTRHTVFDGKITHRYMTVNYDVINSICKERNPSEYAGTKQNKTEGVCQNPGSPPPEFSGDPHPESRVTPTQISGYPPPGNPAYSKEISKEKRKEINNILLGEDNCSAVSSSVISSSDSFNSVTNELEKGVNNFMAKSVTVKCKDTGLQMDRDLAYKVPNKNYYYSSEEAYNSRLVECCDTKTKLPHNECYEDNSLSTTRYFSSEEAFKKYTANTTYRNKCIDFMFDVMGFNGNNSRLDTRFYKDLESYSDVGFEIVYEVLDGERKSIEWAINNKNFETQYQQIKYIFAIVNNNIMKYQKIHKEQELSAALANRNDNDMEYMDDPETWMDYITPKKPKKRSEAFLKAISEGF